MSETQDLPPGLLRQRRNLLMASLFLFLLTFELVDVSTMTFLGAKISPTVGKARWFVVQVSLGTVLYFLYRYLVYASEQWREIKAAFYWEQLRLLGFKRSKFNLDVVFKIIPESLYVKKGKSPEKERQYYCFKKDFDSNDELVSFPEHHFTLWLNLRSLVRVLLKTTIGTDYLLPILIGVVSAGIVIVRVAGAYSYLLF